MKKILLSVLLFCVPSILSAACTQELTGLGLKLPNYGDRGDVWAKCTRDNFDFLNDAIASSMTLAGYMPKTGGVFTGPIYMTSATVVGNAGVGGTMTVTGSLIAGASVQANIFIGDGSLLTGVKDNLGNHTATTTLNMATFGVHNISSMTVEGFDTDMIKVTRKGGGLWSGVLLTQDSMLGNPERSAHINFVNGQGGANWAIGTENSNLELIPTASPANRTTIDTNGLVTATGFSGPLTGTVTGASSLNVSKAGDVMTGSLQTSSLTVTNASLSNIFTVSASSGEIMSITDGDTRTRLGTDAGHNFVVDINRSVDRSFKIVNNAAGAANLIVDGTATVQGSAFSVGGTTLNVNGGNILWANSTARLSGTGYVGIPTGAGYYYNYPTNTAYTYLNGTSLEITAPAVAVTGSAFSVGGTTLAVTSGSVGIGQAANLSYALAVTGNSNFNGSVVTDTLSSRTGGTTGVTSASSWYLTKGDFAVGGSTLNVVAGAVGIRTAAVGTSALTVSGNIDIVAGSGDLRTDTISSKTGGATGITSASTVKLTKGELVVGVSTFIVTGGQVGIGTASPAYALDVLGTIRARGANVQGPFIKYDGDPLYGSALYLPNDTGTQMGAMKIASYYGPSVGDNNLTFYRSTTRAPYTGDASTFTYTAAMTLRGDTGNLGIGTAAPLKSLDVVSSTAVAFLVDNYNTAGGIRLVNNTNTASNGVGIFFEPHGSAYYNANAFSGIVAVRAGGDNYDSHLTFITRPTAAPALERMRILNNGNVGIGATVPGQKLEVAGTILSSATSAGLTLSAPVGNPLLRFEGVNAGVGGTNLAMALYYDVANDALNMRDVANTANRFTVKRSGNVGVGTVDPSLPLEVRGMIRSSNTVNGDHAIYVQNTSASASAATLLLLGNDDNAANGQIQLNSSANTTKGGGHSLNIITRQAAPITFTAGNAIERMRIMPTTGYVGIGTAAPSALLDLAATGVANLAMQRFSAKAGTDNIYYAHGTSYFGNDSYLNPFTTSLNNYQYSRTTGDWVNPKFMGYMGAKNSCVGGFQVIGISTSSSDTAVDITGVHGAAVAQAGIPAVVINANQRSGATSGNISDANMIMGVANNQTLKIVVLGNGHTGFGTVAPKAPLHILATPASWFGTLALQGGAAEVPTLSFNNGTTGGTNTMGLIKYDNATKDMSLQNYNGGAGGSFTMTSGVTARLNIDAIGNVGISTNTPRYKLDVYGGGHFTSTVTVDGNMYLKTYTETITTATVADASYDVDWTLGSVKKILLDAAATTLTFSGAQAGQSMTFLITQGSTDRIITWPTIQWPNNIAPTLSTVTGKTDIISVVYIDGQYWGFVGGQNYGTP